MTDTPQLSGRDLARQALAAYKATARTAPTNTPAKPARKRATRTGSGRDPVSLGAALAGLGADIALESGMAGGNVIDQWPTLCPQYADSVQPVAYDPDRGRLDLRPANYSVASGLRLLGGQLAKQINDKLGKPVVRSIRVLPVGAVQQRDAYTAVYAGPSSAPEPEAPVKTRETASPGYRDTLQAALAHRTERPPADPHVAEVIARQEAALRANREPDTEHRESVWAELDAAAGPAPGSMEASEAAARAYARQHRGGGTPRRAFDAAS